MKRLILFRVLFVGLTGLLCLGGALPARAQEGTAPTRGDTDAYVDATVDIVNPWVGQQVDYTFRYYEAQDAAQLPSILAGAPDYKAPSFSNFWVEGEIEQTSFQIESGGRPYDVSELHTRLFPTTAGELTIDPARLILHDLPQQGERTLETLPVILQVRPLPAGAPEGFGGAVGDFRLTAAVDRSTTQVDEPIALRLTLSGRGNIGLAPTPTLPEMAGWRVLPSGTDEQIDVVNGMSGGIRTWDYQLIPTQPGGIEIPPLEYLFFDPATESYKGTLTEPLRLIAEGNAIAAATAPAADASVAAAVAPSSTPEESPAVAQPLTATASSGLGTTLASETPTATVSAAAITALGSRALSHVTLVDQPWFWALWALPVAAVILGASASVRERRAAQSKVRRNQARAGHDALRALAPVEGQDAVAQCAAAHRVLDAYLERKLGRPVTGLTRSALAALLAQHGGDQELIAQVVACYREIDAARYVPGGSDASAAALQTKVLATIRALEKGLTR